MRLDHSIVLVLGSIVLKNVHVVFPLNSSSETHEGPTWPKGLLVWTPKCIAQWLRGLSTIISDRCDKPGDEGCAWALHPSQHTALSFQVSRTRAAF